MEWSTAARTVWGKTDPESGSWLSLVRHLEDAAAVAGVLWDEFLPRAVQELIAEAIDGSADEARALACWLAGVHDVGKASPEFAWKAAVTFPSLLDAMGQAGLETHAMHSVLGHWTVGQLSLSDWLVARTGASQRSADSFACIVGGHHGRNPASSELETARDLPDAVGKGPWAEVRREILDAMAQLTGADAHLHRWLSRPLPLQAQTALTGFVIMADWLASDSTLFPYGNDTPAPQRAARAAASLDLPFPWEPPAGDVDALALLRKRFPALSEAQLRPIQSSMVEAARVTEPGLMIVEAPMGGGKTEAALLAAEILASRFGQGGIFLGLPTMATANPLFERTLDWLKTCLGPDNASIALAHSKAGLNDRYADVMRKTLWSGQVYNEDEPDRGRAVVNAWLRGRKRAGLASFVVGTVDQGLFGALKAKHLALRHLGLLGKVVIIDEVHSADAYMRVYLNGLLAWLGLYHTPVILMSATLPPDQRDEYVRSYALGRRDRSVPATDRSDAYPRLTIYDGSLTTLDVSGTEDSRNLTVERITDETEATRGLLQHLLADGGCAGVVCNTVRRAQELFQALQADFPGEIELHHSRFLAPERAARAASLVRRLGRDGIERPHRLVVIGTQVLEQSLDIDFDVLVSDLAPIDLVLQRAGRLHRHERGSRPRRVASPVLFLRGVQDWDACPPRAVRGSRSVYGEASLLRSAAVLAGRATVLLPSGIPSLVREGYDDALAPPTGWEGVWADSEAVARVEAASKRSRAASYLIDSPLKRSTLIGWIDVSAGDPDSAAEQGRSSVRDSEDGLEVIVLYRDEDGLHVPRTAPHHGWAVVPESQEWGVDADAAVARAMASCTLALPIELSNEGVIDKVISALERAVDHSGWQVSPWLKGQLVLALDTLGNARLAFPRKGAEKSVGYDLHYSEEEGLTVTRIEVHR